MTDNTVFLNLSGWMQSWDTASRFQLRRTDLYPSKSGVLGLILCSMGVKREDSRETLAEFTSLQMGVRVDCAGRLGWDYHTAGAKIGIRSADGKIKKTQSTGEFEVQLSRRQYLYEASFLVALKGTADQVNNIAHALQNPVWPVFLGRKCCIPSTPVFTGTGNFNTLEEALASKPYQPWNKFSRKKEIELAVYLEHLAGTPPPSDARLAHDVPQGFGFHNHGPRWIVKGKVTVSVDPPLLQPPATPRVRLVDYGSEQWKDARKSRLTLDGWLCVFCKSPAKEVHHVDYSNVGHESDSDLRSLCKFCHNACTMMEYGNDMKMFRIDPADPAQREAMLGQIEKQVMDSRPARHRKLLKAGRKSDFDFFDNSSTRTSGEVE